MCSKFLIFPIIGRRGFGNSDKIYTGEDEQNGEGLGNIEGVQAKTDAGEGCHYGLHIIIHPDNRGPKILLPYHDADIGDECAEHDHVPYPKPLR